MDPSDRSKFVSEQSTFQSSSGLPPVEQSDLVAWEELESGRFRPRRIRGSCLNMELG